MNAEEDGDTATGFTLSRVLPGTPAEVFAHFTEPALFSRWFVVEGYTTPASRISLDSCYARKWASRQRARAGRIPAPSP